MNTKQEAPVSAGDAIKEFQRCINALALELPGVVWDDVNKRWSELKSQIAHQPVSVQVEGLREDAESYFERSKQTFTGVFAGDYLDREDFINYIISSPSGQEKDAVGETVSMEEYNHAIDEIGQLQEQLKEANEYIRDLQKGDEH